MILGLGKPQLKLTENALKVLASRYLLKDEDGKVLEKPLEMFKRVSSFIIKAEENYKLTKEQQEELEKAFLTVMVNLEFLPNSPTFTGAGTPLGQLAACFVLPIGDSMEEIFSAIKYTALIHKSGGGTGFSFSRLRPAKSQVKSTQGLASGPLSFMTVFDAATNTVKQGGTRRGANMGILRIDHPDIMEFISAKTDSDKLNNFNISVAITDKFMAALDQSGEYELINPSNNQAAGKLKAKEVWEKIVNQVWKNGDPGVIFIDKINHFNPTPHIGLIESTNPCVSGEMLVPTERGLEKIEKVYDNYLKGGINKGILVDNRTIAGGGVELKAVAKVYNNGKKPVMKLITKAGYELIATYDHRVLTERGWIKMSDLMVDDIVFLQSGEGKFNHSFSLPIKIVKKTLPRFWSKELGQVLGLLVGDGWLRTGDRNCRIGFTFSQDEKKLLNKFKKIINQWYGFEIKPVLRDNNIFHLSYHAQWFVDFFRQLGVKPVKAKEKIVPATIFTAPKEAIIGFLQGLFTADGTVNFVKGHSAYVRLTAKSLILLKEVQLLLLNLGIKSKIYPRHRPARKTFNYLTKNGQKKNYLADGICYELEISKQSVLIFLEKISFIDDKHQAKIKMFKKKSFYRDPFEDQIASLEKWGEKIVYDLTEITTHSYLAGGILVHNCGEQPLLPYESCNLGSINLAKFITDGKIDWDRLSAVTKVAVRFLDDVIDMNRYPLKEIEKMTQANRKIGLGVMGWADMLIQLGIAYNSQEAIDLAEKLMKFIKDDADATSIELAKEKGVFPNFEGSIYDTPESQGMRNATRTTIAPTGTLSIIASCSSGIEPIFAVAYTRKSHLGKKGDEWVELVEVNPYFKKIAKDRGFYAKELMEKIAQAGSLHDFAEIPDDVKRVFVTAHDIAPEWHVRMQAAFQKYIDNAVSKTINFPHLASKDDVAKAYLLSYELGCKGITIYRDGSRDVQVLTTGKSHQKVEVPTTPFYKKERPMAMKGTTYKVKTSYGDLYVTINDDEAGNPFEVFATIGKAGGFFSAKSEAICRLVSLALRAGIPPEEVIKQIKGIRGPMPSWSEGGMILSLPDAIAQILERHLSQRQPALGLAYHQVPQMTKQTITQPVAPVNANQVNNNHNGNGLNIKRDIADYGDAPECPECGNILEISEGCLKCQVCGFSKCG